MEQGQPPAESRPLGIGESVLYQNVGDEVVLLNLETQEYFGLDSVGADVWRLLMDEGDVANVIRRLTQEYAADEETVRGDVDSLISELTAANLLSSSPSEFAAVKSGGDIVR